MTKAIEFVEGQDWAITERGLETIRSVVHRVNLDPEIVESQLGRPLDNSQTATVTDGVAVIPVAGPISRYANIFTRISGGTSVEILARDFRAAIDDPKVRAVVLNIDSPGGTVNGISEFAAQVYAARGAKPVVAYAAHSACSGAYWIASACSEIVCSDTADLGSIGVVGGYVRQTKDGPVRVMTSSRAKNKRPDYSTVEGEALVQRHLDDVEDVFVSTVARYRGTTDDQVIDGFEQGNSIIASRAIAAGMADRLGSLDGLIAELSRGEWRAPAPKFPPAPKAAVPQPRRAAMSEPNQTASVAAPTAEPIDYKALHEQEVKKRVAAEQAVQAEVDKRLDAAADTFVASLSAGDRAVFTPAETVERRAEFLQAARDDHERPVPGKPRFRQAALEAAHSARKPHGLITEKANADPTTQSRALGMDPAGVTSPATEEAGREERRRLNQQAIERRQGKGN